MLYPFIYPSGLYEDSVNIYDEPEPQLSILSPLIVFVYIPLIPPYHPPPAPCIGDKFSNFEFELVGRNARPNNPPDVCVA